MKKISSEIEIHYEDLSDTYPHVIKDIAEIIIKQCKEPEEKVRISSFEWLAMLLNKYKSIIHFYINEKDNKNIQDNKFIQRNKNILMKVGLLDKDEHVKQIYVSNLIKNIPFKSFPDILDVLVENAKLSTNKQITVFFEKCNLLFKNIILTVPIDIIGPNLKKLEMQIQDKLDHNNNNI